ncbi:MAG: hypothetical protein LUE10_04400 [Alistipes sp.]|nr:hypothetical protein [Alistipes sp.]
MQLIRDADPSPESVADHLHRGEINAGYLDGKIVGEYILLHIQPQTSKIVNLAVAQP